VVLHTILTTQRNLLLQQAFQNIQIYSTKNFSNISEILILLFGSHTKTFLGIIMQMIQHMNLHIDYKKPKNDAKTSQRWQAV